jgi:hypothetical protein
LTVRPPLLPFLLLLLFFSCCHFNIATSSGLLLAWFLKLGHLLISSISLLLGSSYYQLSLQRTAIIKLLNSAGAIFISTYLPFSILGGLIPGPPWIPRSIDVHYSYLKLFSISLNHP